MRLDYVLALKTEDFMERRLQTQVFKSGLAKSIHHARVLIRQRVSTRIASSLAVVDPRKGGKLTSPPCSVPSSSAFALRHHPSDFPPHSSTSESASRSSTFPRSLSDLTRRVRPVLPHTWPLAFVSLIRSPFPHLFPEHIDFSTTSPFGGARSGRVKRRREKNAKAAEAGGDAAEEEDDD